MRTELKKRIIAYNKEKAQDKEKADDWMTFLSHLPPGQVKQLKKNATCAAILQKYGIGGEEE